MRKTIDIETIEQLEKLEHTVLSSMSKTTKQIAEIPDDFKLFSFMKFGGVGCDPLVLERELNVIEQINQAFNYFGLFSGN